MPYDRYALYQTVQRRARVVSGIILQAAGCVLSLCGYIAACLPLPDGSGAGTLVQVTEEAVRVLPFGGGEGSAGAGT